MTYRRFTLLIALAAVLGVLGGVVAPSPSAAQVPTFHLTVNPGSVDNRLMCGWHDTCLAGQYGNPGQGLDWGNFGNQKIYWRSWGWRGDGGSGMMGSGGIWTDDTACYRVTVTTYDLWGYYQGAIHYTHSATFINGWSLNFPGGNGTWSYSGDIEIGFTVANEKSTSCPWEAAHLHQFGSWQYGRNTGLYPHASQYNYGVNTWTLRTYPVASNGYWQNGRQW